MINVWSIQAYTLEPVASNYLAIGRVQHCKVPQYVDAALKSDAADIWKIAETPSYLQPVVANYRRSDDIYYRSFIMRTLSV